LHPHDGDLDECVSRGGRAVRAVALIVVLLVGAVGAGCTIQLAPNDDLVRRVGVLEADMRATRAWSEEFARQVSAEFEARPRAVEEEE
jgi:hypothetical protein